MGIICIGEVTMPFLPPFYVLELVARHFGGNRKGITTYYVQDFNAIVEDIQTKKPTIILAMPRVCEKRTSWTACTLQKDCRQNSAPQSIKSEWGFLKADRRMRGRFWGDADFCFDITAKLMSKVI
jgi:long-subunit acyl-CoA synthetase (AMP-forming)